MSMENPRKASQFAPWANTEGEFIFIVAQECRNRGAGQVSGFVFWGHGGWFIIFFLKQAGLVCPYSNKHIGVFWATELPKPSSVHNLTKSYSGWLLGDTKGRHNVILDFRVNICIYTPICIYTAHTQK